MHVVVPVGSLVDGARIPLDADEAHHLDVRRTAEHDTAHAIDGAGGIGFGRLERDAGGWVFAVELTAHEAEPPITILAVAAGDRDRFLLVAEKAAELGVTRLVPLETSHTRDVATRLRDNAMVRVRRRVREACKQSGNPWFPVVDEPHTLAALRDAGHPVRWFLADGQGRPRETVSSQAAVGWLIGPEAGFTAPEIAVIENDLAAVRVALGRHVLRFETAAIAAAVVTESDRAAMADARRR